MCFLDTWAPSHLCEDKSHIYANLKAIPLLQCCTANISISSYFRRANFTLQELSPVVESNASVNDCINHVFSTHDNTLTG